MRRTFIALAVTLPIGCSQTSHQAGTPPSTPSSAGSGQYSTQASPIPPAEGGCPSADIPGCVVHLVRAFSVSERDLQRETAELNKVDVNGNRILKKSIHLSVRGPGTGKFSMIVIHLA